MATDDNENLNYISSVDPFEPEKNTVSVDAADEKALVRLVRVVDEQIALYHTIDGMKLFPKRFSADTRLTMCDHQVGLLRGYKKLITNAIDGIKEAAK